MFNDNRWHLANVYRRRKPTFVKFTQQLVIHVVLYLRFTTNANRRLRHLPPTAADIHDMLFEHLILPTDSLEITQLLVCYFLRMRHSALYPTSLLAEFYSSLQRRQSPRLYTWQ